MLLNDDGASREQAEAFLKKLNVSSMKDENEGFTTKTQEVESETIAQEFKTTINRVFREFPNYNRESVLNELLDDDVATSIEDKMKLVYYYLLRIIEFFNLSGDSIKGGLGTNLDVLELTMSIEKKLIINIKNNCVRVIETVLRKHGGAVINFLKGENIELSSSSTLILMTSSTNDGVEKGLILRQLLFADYLKRDTNHDEENKILQFFKTVVDESLLDDMQEIFTSNLIKNVEDVLPFFSMIIRNQDIRGELATLLYNNTKLSLGE